MEEQDRFARYLSLLLHWNRTHHLTSLRSPEEVVRKLFIDSLLFINLFPPRPLKLVDIGAGSGIPGMPLRIVDSGIVLTLIEAKRKRTSFLTALREDLRIDNVEIINARAEDVLIQVPKLFGKFDVAVVRAVALPASLSALALDYLRPGGMFIASGPPADVRQPPISNAEWRILSFTQLGLTRQFAVVIKDS